MSQSKDKRSARSDRNRIAISERDLRLVEFIADQYMVPLDLFQELMGRYGQRGPVGYRSAYMRAERLELAGLIHRERLLARMILVASPLGMRQVGRDFDRKWRPAPMMLTHTTAVARLRLHLQDAHPDATWESERQIRHRWANSGARVRIADGGLYLPGKTVGIEAELTMKPADRYPGIVEDQDSRWAEVWWYARPGSVGTLRQRLTDAGAVNHRVFPLPEGVTP